MQMKMKMLSILAATVLALLFASQAAFAFDCPPAGPGNDSTDNCVEITIPGGSTANQIVTLLEAAWDEGDFSCSISAGGNGLVVSLNNGTRTVTYTVVTDLTAPTTSYTFRLVGPSGRSQTDATCSQPQPFPAFASLAGGGEQQLFDNTPIVLAGGGGAIRMTASTLFTCETALDSSPVPTLGTWTAIIAGMALLAGGAMLIAMRS